MEKVVLKRLQMLKHEKRDTEEKLREIKIKIRRIAKSCDHKHPDGRTAWSSIDKACIRCDICGELRE